MLLFRHPPPSCLHFRFTTGRGMMGNRMFASTFRSDDSRTFNAILATRPKVRGGEEIRRTAKNALTRILDREELHIKNVMNEPFVGNRLGLNLAGLVTRHAAIEKKFTSQQEELSLQKEKLASQEKKLSGPTEEVLSLMISSEGYKRGRNRFPSTFKRDILKKKAT
ncbi:hypothetical protein L873DRAFT_1899979 [Choiromyces venosus 120613-1]|uniref:Uncharacterized protein n=1 Tax=Choiromyces venosus 120613-1 TaxID=1336337 RepID=A0A3N4JTS6_9PEZI|nr:hypothetical protein L873DRAFT_1899979 [Choiromyces venosus 120613-1]